MLLGVLGGGQLGRMLALAAAPLGVRVRCYDPDADGCAGDVCELHSGAWDDAGSLAKFAQGCDCVTFEFENVPVATVHEIEKHSLVFPSAISLETGQDRLREKRLFEKAGLRVHAYAHADTENQLVEAVARVGTPCVIKTRRGGYDGKGQVVLREAADANRAWHELAGVPLLIESFVQFERELSLIAVRGRDGAFASYPLTHNRHERGILRESVAPAQHVDPAIACEAALHMHELMDRLEYVGVLAIEFFVLKIDGQTMLLANEMAPRVHNSGHWTMDAGITSQFENHVRAVMGMPLGNTSPTGVCAMVNLVGDNPVHSDVMTIENARLHLYGKESRANRKIGHVNIHGANWEIISPCVAQLIAIARACDRQY